MCRKSKLYARTTCKSSTSKAILRFQILQCTLMHSRIRLWTSKKKKDIYFTRILTKRVSHYVINILSDPSLTIWGSSYLLKGHSRSRGSHILYRFRQRTLNCLNKWFLIAGLFTKHTVKIYWSKSWSIPNKAISYKQCLNCIRHTKMTMNFGTR